MKPAGHYEAAVCVGRKRVSRRFRRETHLSVIRQWRANEIARLKAEAAGRPVFKTSPHACPPSPDGWCYIYVIQDGPAVKIGRAVDPLRRLDELQTAHRGELSLVVAVPAHAALEAEIHRRFAHLLVGREWFRVDSALSRFIEALQTGANPVALLWGVGQESPARVSGTETLTRTESVA